MCPLGLRYDKPVDHESENLDQIRMVFTNAPGSPGSGKSDALDLYGQTISSAHRFDAIQYS